MPDIAEVWSQALPIVRQGVTGVGVWAALNSAKPIMIDEGTFVIGLAPGDTELSGHLRLPMTKKLIENEVGKRLGLPVLLRVIDGTTPGDWERVKRRDVEAKRLQEQAHTRARAEIESKVSWDLIYEQLGRKYAQIPNKSLPQNRARFFKECVEIIAESRKNQPNRDELSERNFARVLERVSQYSEIPAAMIALEVLKQAGEI